MGELMGSDPDTDEILVVGGHIDSWDVGTGLFSDLWCYADWLRVSGSQFDHERIEVVQIENMESTCGERRLIV